MNEKRTDNEFTMILDLEISDSVISPEEIALVMPYLRELFVEFMKMELEG